MAQKKKRKNTSQRFIRILVMSIAIVTFWWGVWGILDTLFQISNPLIGYFIGIIIALLILYLDDFHLKELE
jgi:hypothetical protein